MNGVRPKKWLFIETESMKKGRNMDIKPFINSKDIAGELDFILREDGAENLPVKYAWLKLIDKYQAECLNNK